MAPSDFFTNVDPRSSMTEDTMHEHMSETSDDEPKPAGRSDSRKSLDACEKAVGRLHKMCCEPDRSPEMTEIQNALGGIGKRLASNDPIDEDRILMALEAVGARIARLQVGCCAPARMPLYAEALAGLNEIQLSINRARGTGH